tara:strand:+ start:157 stop:498 length:342 start_codon:yes stop_codon:yes gene_type:complete
MDAGGVGVISVASNVAPGKVSQMVHYFLNGNHDAARDLDKKLSPLYDALFPRDKEGKSNKSPNPVMAHYALERLDRALERMNLNVGVPRLPLMRGAPEERTAMYKVLGDLNLL